MKISINDVVKINNKMMKMSNNQRKNIPNYVNLTEKDINDAYKTVLLKNKYKKHYIHDIINKSINNMRYKYQNQIKKDYNIIDSKFKKGDIVVCISIDGIVGKVDIEIGRKYKIININTIKDTDSSKSVSFLQLENVNTVYLDKYFQSIQDNRREKINRLKKKSKKNIFKKIINYLKNV